MKYTFTITNQKQIAEGIYEITLDTSSSDFSYKAGQYIYLRLRFDVDDTRGNGREFSLISSPQEKGEIAIVFKDTGSGFKRSLLKCPLGTMVDIEGPFGTFILSDALDEKILFIAGGVGIAPFVSILRDVSSQGKRGDFSLWYTFKQQEGAVYLEELQSFDEQKLLKRLITKNSRITQEDIVRFVTSDFVKIYVSGPPAMVSHTYVLLREIGIPSKRIRLEEFTGYDEEQVPV